jgi:hypothetical protein
MFDSCRTGNCCRPVRDQESNNIEKFKHREVVTYRKDHDRTAYMCHVCNSA